MSKRANVIIVVALLVVALGAWAIVTWVTSAAPVAYAVVHDGDGGETRLDLSQNQTITVSTSKGTNVVEVADGRVRVASADCPHQDCVDKGWISDGSEQIVCLPHELWIEVVGGDTGATDVESR